MLKSLTIENYRAFPRFEMNNLGRVNLLVGTNNCGKTSILEAIYMLMSAGNTIKVMSICDMRGEIFDENTEIKSADSTLHRDIRCMFSGRSIDLGSQFSVGGDYNNIKVRFNVNINQSRVRNSQIGEYTHDSTDLADSSMPGSLSCNFYWTSGPGVSSERRFDLSRKGGISLDHVSHSILRKELPLSYVTTKSLPADEVVSLYEDIVLKPEEDSVIKALQIIEPSIERIATAGSPYWFSDSPFPTYQRGGIFVRCRGIDDRVPIGSMGDGIWRLLGLALSLVKAKNGVLLVDEIDTGLHHTVMDKMWKLVAETARRLNVQVFATTHSRDCYESLATVCRDNVSEGSDITIQRIEREKGRAIAYNEQEIRAVAEHELEVR